MADNSQLALLDGLVTRPVVREGRGGRPLGARNKRRSVAWRLAEVATESIMRQMIMRAQRLEDQIDYQCAVTILSRTWPKSRSAPVQIDLTQNVDARSLLAAVADGQMTPTDASSLWNSLSRNGSGPSATAELVPKGDARERVARKLAGIVAARIAAAPANGNGNGSTGSHEMAEQPDAGQQEPEGKTLEAMITEISSWEEET